MKKEISFPSKLENISIVENLIDEVSENSNLNSILYGNMLVSLVEAVSNAIIHGNKSDEKKLVKVVCSINGEYIFFSVRDEGNGFEHGKIPDPTSSKNINKPHGRGIFLMSKLSDKMYFKDGGKEIEFRFKLR